MGPYPSSKPSIYYRDQSESIYGNYVPKAGSTARTFVQVTKFVIFEESEDTDQLRFSISRLTAAELLSRIIPALASSAGAQLLAHANSSSIQVIRLTRPSSRSRPEHLKAILPELLQLLGVEAADPCNGQLTSKLK